MKIDKKRTNQIAKRMTRPNCLLKAIPSPSEQPFPSRLKKMPNAPSFAVMPTKEGIKESLDKACSRSHEKSAEKLLVSGGLLPHTSAGPGAAGITGQAQIGGRRPRASAARSSTVRIASSLFIGPVTTGVECSPMVSST